MDEELLVLKQHVLSVHKMVSWLCFAAMQELKLATLITDEPIAGDENSGRTLLDQVVNWGWREKIGPDGFPSGGEFHAVAKAIDLLLNGSTTELSFSPLTEITRYRGGVRLKDLICAASAWSADADLQMALMMMWNMRGTLIPRRVIHVHASATQRERAIGRFEALSGVEPVSMDTLGRGAYFKLEAPYTQRKVLWVEHVIAESGEGPMICWEMQTPYADRFMKFMADPFDVDILHLARFPKGVAFAENRGIFHGVTAFKDWEPMGH